MTYEDSFDVCWELQVLISATYRMKYVIMIPITRQVFVGPGLRMKHLMSCIPLYIELNGDFVLGVDKVAASFFLYDLIH